MHRNMARTTKTTTKDVESLKHRESQRKNIPTAEFETLVSEEEQAQALKTMRWERNTEFDPQLVWRAKTSRTQKT
jgi:adenine-specific DNA-methyltransferase